MRTIIKDGSVIIIKESYLKLLCLLVFIINIFPVNTYSQDNIKSQKLKRNDKRQIVEQIAEMLDQKYVYPEQGTKIANYIRFKLKENEYKEFETAEKFTKILTSDMQSINGDLHLGALKKRNLPYGNITDEMRNEFYRSRSILTNFGFKTVSRLPGNVGYIFLDELVFPEMDGEDFAGETARAVMQFVSSCSAVIFDLTDNFGGRPEMVSLLFSYLFKNKEHLSTDMESGKEGEKLWTEELSGVKTLFKTPVYVLTSRHTVSGGEFFAFALQNRKRATIIGEKTKGAAHKTHVYPVKGFEIEVSIPHGTTIDPLTSSNWEGKGVKPDIEIPTKFAKDKAYFLALMEIKQNSQDQFLKAEIEWAIPEVEAKLNPISLKTKDLKEFEGVFGERIISIRNGELTYSKGDNKTQILIPMSNDLFAFQDGSMFYVRISFIRDESSKIIKMRLLYDTGQKTDYDKM